MLRYLLRIIDNLYINFASSLTGRVYCFLFNLRALILIRKIRFKYLGSGLYLAKDNNQHRYFKAREQNFLSYHKGFYTRANVLLRDYHLDKIDFFPNDLIVDCGANVGDLKLYFDFNGIDIRYIAFEPSIEEFECLEKNVAPSKSFNMGLWNKNGVLDFFVSSEHADSSIIEPPHYSSKTSISVARFDSIFNGEEKIKLLKLEAEGAEPEVLIGCGDMLSRIEYISADLGYERGVNQETTFNDVTNYLLKNNFELEEVGFTRIVALYRNIAFKS